MKTIVDSWVKCKPMVFKVPGAQYISATNNAVVCDILKIGCGVMNCIRYVIEKKYLYEKMVYDT